ncbi:hypothetical protein GTU73_11225 [Rathayibacter sp. VKM Ac-2804]|uniref:hypothetical protein n=1 Tax=Rathayibacter sp. VKM Ac-2804 TaxID=2609257 RepID=UPI00132F2E24|nr:hypothetical protein [Rathayibacter sp. VKM Ac-2804]QHF24523.1 hypothetical protein GTU73_11225 [Rathayibacter sp. VKM Ac-2804]
MPAPSGFDRFLEAGFDFPLLLAVPIVLIGAVALGVVVVVSRQLAAPRALIAASATGGVVVRGGPDFARLLVFADPTLAHPGLRPYVVLVPSADVLTLLAGPDEAEVLWDEIRRVEWRTAGPRGRRELVLSFTRGKRLRSVLLRPVEEPGLLGLRAAGTRSVERLRSRLLAHVPETPPESGTTTAPWGSRNSGVDRRA